MNPQREKNARELWQILTADLASAGVRVEQDAWRVELTRLSRSCTVFCLDYDRADKGRSIGPAYNVKFYADGVIQSVGRTKDLDQVRGAVRDWVANTATREELSVRHPFAIYRDDFAAFGHTILDEDVG